MKGLFDNINLAPGASANPFDFLADTPPAADAAPQGVTPIAPATVMPDAGPGGALPAPNLSGGVLPNLSGQALQGTVLGGAPAADDDAPATPAMLAPQSGFRGLLGRLTAPDPTGITFSDKLNAIGSILQGHSDQADKYMTDRRAAIVKQQEEAQKLKDAAEKQRIAGAAGQALARNTRPDNTINVQGYLKDMAALNQSPDDKVLSAVYGHNIPEYVATTGKNGEFTISLKNPMPGQDPIVYHKEGTPEPERGRYFDNAPGQPLHEAYIGGGSQDPKTVEAISHGKRLGAPLQGRAGPKRSAFAPNEVQRRNTGT